MKKFLRLFALLFALLATSFGAHAEPNTQIYELRTYTTPPGKLPDLLTRFKDHGRRLLAKHDMISIGYWIPVDKPNTIIYILAHPNQEAATKNWAAFKSDPDWIAASDASLKNGPLVDNVDSVFMSPTIFSTLK